MNLIIKFLKTPLNSAIMALGLSVLTICGCVTRGKVITEADIVADRATYSEGVKREIENCNPLLNSKDSLMDGSYIDHYKKLTNWLLKWMPLETFILRQFNKEQGGRDALDVLDAFQNSVKLMNGTESFLKLSNARIDFLTSLEVTPIIREKAINEIRFMQASRESFTKEIAKFNNAYQEFSKTSSKVLSEILEGKNAK